MGKKKMPGRGKTHVEVERGKAHEFQGTHAASMAGA